MSSRAMQPLPLLLLVAALALCASSSLLLLSVHGAPCGVPPPLDPATPVRIAILGYCKAPAGVLPANPNRPESGCAPDTSPRGPLIAAYWDGLDMYEKAMGAQTAASGGMPLTSGGKATFSFTYINLGYVDWLASTAGFRALEPIMGDETSGMLHDILMTSTYGGPYTFVVPQLFSRDAESVIMSNICEDEKSCILIHPFASSPNFAICYKDEAGNLPADCVRHNKLEGMRRFNNFLGVLFDSTAVALSALDTYHTLGVKRIVVLSELGGQHGFARFPLDATKRTVEFAKQLNIEVVKVITLEVCDEATRKNCWRKADGTIDPSQIQTYPDGHTRESFAAMLKDLNPDGLTCIGSPSGLAFRAFAEMFDGFRTVGWQPKMINWAGGVDSYLKPYMSNYDDLLYSWSTQPYDGRLTGPSYHNVETDSNFELFPATDDLDGPQVFAREYNGKYGSKYNGGKGYNFQAVNAVIPVLGYHCLTIAQKLIETALSADVDTLILASLRLSVPSVYHQMQFDPSGRTTRVNEVLLQYIPGSAAAHGIQLIAPYGIGVPVVFPTPTFEERVFEPELYSDPLEVMVAAITAVSIAVCVVILAVILAHARHAVIRAATPSFCALTILGAVLMLLSNFFHTLVATESHCAAQVWLLSLGFTLLFSSLFIKTFRIWKIFFSSKKLVVQKLKDSTMLLAVLGFVLVDIVINAAWAGSAGMGMKEVVVDPLRPSLNFRTCDYSDTLPAVYTHVGVKCGLLLFGIVLTWAVRHTPSQFNESSYIGVAIYNVSIVICFVVPLLSSGVGGRTASTLIRAFAIIFVTLSTVAILFIPKLITIYGKGPAGGKTVFDENGNGSALPGQQGGNESIYADPDAVRSSAGQTSSKAQNQGTTAPAGHSFHKSKEMATRTHQPNHSVGGNGSGGVNHSGPGVALRIATRSALASPPGGVPSPSGTPIGGTTSNGGLVRHGHGHSTPSNRAVSPPPRAASPPQQTSLPAQGPLVEAQLQSSSGNASSAEGERPGSAQKDDADAQERYVVTIMPGQIAEAEGEGEGQ